jgi:hypothetical protein
MSARLAAHYCATFQKERDQKQIVNRAAHALDTKDDEEDSRSDRSPDRPNKGDGAAEALLKRNYLYLVREDRYKLAYGGPVVFNTKALLGSYANIV